MRAAYDLGAKQILAMSKYPPSTKIMPIDKSWFVVLGQVNGNDVVTAYLVFDGQNSYGGMIRSTAICIVTPAKKIADCDWKSLDMVAREMIPSNAVRGPQPKHESQ